MQIAALLTEARNALSMGDRAKAKQLASQALRLDSKQLEPWLLLAEVVEAAEQKRDCFQRVLALDPTNLFAKQGLQRLDTPPVAPAITSIELPKSAWFNSKPAEQELSAQVGGVIATPSLPTSTPSSGIRPLAQTVTPSLAELSNTPVGIPAPPMGYVQPIQVGYAQPNAAQPNQAYPIPPINYAQPQYNQVAYPYVEPSGAAKFLKWLVFATIGLVVVCVGIGALSLLGREAAPTPKVSAQDRTTALLNDTFKIVTDPDFYNEQTQTAMVENFEQKYTAPTAYSYSSFFDGFSDSYDSADSTEGGFSKLAPYIKDSYVTPVTYEVVEESATKITLRIIAGDCVVIYHNGSFDKVPLKVAFDTFTWINEDGIWYVHDIQNAKSACLKC